MPQTNLSKSSSANLLAACACQEWHFLRLRVFAMNHSNTQDVLQQATCVLHIQDLCELLKDSEHAISQDPSVSHALPLTQQHLSPPKPHGMHR